MIHITERIVLQDHDIEERFVRAAGPGHKNAQHDAIAVELRVDLGKLALPRDVAERLVLLAGKRVTKDGILVVVARGDESQTRNREAARERLLKLFAQAAEEPPHWRPTRPRRKVRVARREVKERHHELKHARRPSAGDGDAGRPAEDE